MMGSVRIRVAIGRRSGRATARVAGQTGEPRASNRRSSRFNSASRDDAASSRCGSADRAACPVAGPADSRPDSDAGPEPDWHALALQQGRARIVEEKLFLFRRGPTQQIDRRLNLDVVSASRRRPSKWPAGCPRATASTAAPARPTATPNAISACASALNRSNSASRRHTQLLCLLSSWAASTCVSPSSRTSACTSQASSNSLGRPPTLLSP